MNQSPRSLGLEAFPIACRVASSLASEKARTTAQTIMNTVAGCSATRAVMVGGGMARIERRCSRWQTTRRPDLAALTSYVANVERMGLAPDLDLSCVDASADLVRPLLSEPGEPAALLRRLELAVASYQRAAQCAKGASANTNTNTNRASSLTPLQSGGGGALRPEQQMWNNAVHDLEQSHGLARQRYEQELTVREGNGQTDSPDEPSLLRRQAKGALAHHQLGKAVAALERAVQILTLAFGAQDAETIAATAELRAAQHGAAGSEATQGSLQACEARLLGRLETSQETLSALRSYHALSKSGRPVPPAAYGAACRALRGEDEFGDEQWSDPIVSQPLADAAQQSIALVPRAAVAEQVNALLLQAARLGVGPGPDFSSACPDGVLRLAQVLLSRNALPADPRIALVQSRLTSVQRCARGTSAVR